MGYRSAVRFVVYLLRKKHTAMKYIIDTLQRVYDNSAICEICGNVDVSNVCAICSNQKRDDSTLCVVADIADLWSIERIGFYSGKYHVLGGKLSAVNGVLPSDLSVDKLCERIVSTGTVKEVIMATSADIDGQATALFVNDRIKNLNVQVTILAHGVPVGGELEYLDNGTIIAAFKQRHDI
jgi:recombination protein RecR